MSLLFRGASPHSVRLLPDWRLGAFAALACLWSSACFDFSCRLGEDLCDGDFSCAAGEICESDLFGRVCQKADVCNTDLDCAPLATCVQRGSQPADNPFESARPGKGVCECNVASCSASAGAGGTAGTGGTAGAAGRGGSAGSGGTGGVPIVDENTGAPCTQDADCASGEFCSGPDDFFYPAGPSAGGAAFGYCTRDCIQNQDCGAGNRCMDGLCVESCFTMGPLSGVGEPLDPAKCHGRDDVACTPTGLGAVCMPTCPVDAAGCGGLACDPRTRTCVSTPNAGLPTGAACDPAADACAGVCTEMPLPGGGSAPLCAERCVLGGSVAFDCEGQGICLSPFPYGAGDAGDCFVPCTSHADCATPAAWCVAALVGGVCAPTTSCLLDSECAIPGFTCIDTPMDGKQCLTDENLDGVSDFPFFAASGGAGGAAGAGGAGGGP